MLFQHRQLIQRGAVEDHIRILLIRENPPLLSPAHAVPHGEGMLYRRAPGLIVPYDSAKQPQITGGDTVMVIQVERQQRADIKPENQGFFHIFREHCRIQSMKALHNNHGILCQCQYLPCPFSAAGNEIEAGKLYAFPCQQMGHILPEQSYVNGIDVLQIQLPIRAGGDFIPVNVVVIQTHEDWFFPMDTKLGRQAMGRSRLTGGTGACQHNRLRTTLADHVCHLRKPLFMQRFVHPDQFPDSA